MGYYTKHHPCDGCDKPILGNSLICIDCARRNYAAGLQDVAYVGGMGASSPKRERLRESFFNPKDLDIFENMMIEVGFLERDVEWNDIILFIETVYSRHLDGKYDLEASVV